MKWTDVATQLFGNATRFAPTANFLSGSATFDGQAIAVVGSTNHAPIGYALALRQAKVVLETIDLHPGRAIFLLIDTQASSCAVMTSSSGSTARWRTWAAASTGTAARPSCHRPGVRPGAARAASSPRA
jgi:hypothetical protein